MKNNGYKKINDLLDRMFPTLSEPNNFQTGESWKLLRIISQQACNQP